MPIHGKVHTYIQRCTYKCGAIHFKPVSGFTMHVFSIPVTAVTFGWNRGDCWTKNRTHFGEWARKVAHALLQTGIRGGPSHFITCIVPVGIRRYNIMNMLLWMLPQF